MLSITLDRRTAVSQTGAVFSSGDSETFHTVILTNSAGVNHNRSRGPGKSLAFCRTNHRLVFHPELLYTEQRQ